MGVFNLQEAARPNILQLKPYRSARDDYQEGILLDANENSYRAIGHDNNPHQLNRYPDPHQLKLKQRLRVLRPDITSEEQIFVGVGSDEVLDMIVRIFCRPGLDQILITPPTYGMYSVTAQINDIGVLKSLLTPNHFQLNLEEMKSIIDSNMDTLKVIFLCSPGNPTGSCLNRNSIEEILNYPYKGVVVVDEAYVDFSNAPSTTDLLQKYPNLIVMQTLSKSFGLAGIRLGVGFSHPDIIRLMNNTKAPYNVSSLTSHAALEALTDSSLQSMRETVATMNQARSELQTTLANFPDLAPPLGTTDANFLLVPVLGHSSREPSNLRALHIYEYLAQTLKVVIRYRANEPNCPGCLRITVGTPEDHRVLVDGLRQAIQANLTD